MSICAGWTASVGRLSRGLPCSQGCGAVEADAAISWPALPRAPPAALAGAAWSGIALHVYVLFWLLGVIGSPNLRIALREPATLIGLFGVRRTASALLLQGDQRDELASALGNYA